MLNFSLASHAPWLTFFYIFHFPGSVTLHYPSFFCLIYALLECIKVNLALSPGSVLSWSLVVGNVLGPKCTWVTEIDHRWPSQHWAKDL